MKLFDCFSVFIVSIDANAVIINKKNGNESIEFSLKLQKFGWGINYYRFAFDKLYLDEGIKNIKNEPVGYVILFFKKAISFLLINSQSMDPKYFNPFNYLPLLFFGIASLVGIFLYNKKSLQYNYLMLVLIAYVAIFSTVAILPRYKLIILPLQIIFTSVFIEKIKSYYLNLKKNK